MPEPIVLRHFKETEFTLYQHMDPEFLYYLDEVRERCGFKFFLTSDARPPGMNAAAGGAATSLHLCEPVKGVKARAVDFGIASFAHRPFADFATFVKTVFKVRDDMLLPFGVQAEIVYSSRDKHLHLGLFRDNRPDVLVVAVD